MRVFILTISDRSYRKERADGTGPLLIECAQAMGFEIAGYEVLPDDRAMISAKLASLSDSNAADVIFTAGGTGFAERDITPEATIDVAEKMVPGIAEVIRAESLKYTRHAMLSRGVAAIRKKTLIVNLPGSPKGAGESFRAIEDTLEHGIEILKGSHPDG